MVLNDDSSGGGGGGGQGEGGGGMVMGWNRLVSQVVQAAQDANEEHQILAKTRNAARLVVERTKQLNEEHHVVDRTKELTTSVVDRTKVITTNVVDGTKGLTSTAVQRAKEIDEEHQVWAKTRALSTSVVERVKEIDEQHHIVESTRGVAKNVAEKAREIDEEHHLSANTMAISDSIVQLVKEVGGVGGQEAQTGEEVMRQRTEAAMFIGEFEDDTRLTRGDDVDPPVPAQQQQSDSAIEGTTASGETSATEKSPSDGTSGSPLKDHGVEKKDDELFIDDLLDDVSGSASGSFSIDDVDEEELI